MMRSKDIRIRLRLPRGDAFVLDVDLTLPAKGITVVYGPSGAGKTSVLRCVAGLERPEVARVGIGGACWEDSETGVRMPTWRRPIGYVFQEPNLFPHLDVRGNIEFGLKRARASRFLGPAGQEVARDNSDPDSRIRTPRQSMDTSIALLGISHLLTRRPQQLSGGEQRRVAIARALATQPQLLLLDEPLSALDQARRQDILPWLEALRDKVGIPMLYVTHSVDELVRLADTVVLMADGRVSACGPAAKIMRQLGAQGMAADDACALIEARIVERESDWHLVRAEFEGGSLWLRDEGQALGRRLRLRVLARDVSLSLEKPVGTSIQNLLPGRILAIDADPLQQGQVLVTIQCGAADNSTLLSKVTARSVHQLGLVPGLAVWSQVKAVALVS